MKKQIKKKRKDAKPESELLKFVRRYEAVRGLMRRFDSGERIELREISLVLGKQAEKAFREAWKNEQDVRISQLEKPDAVSIYEKRLIVADLMFGRAEQLAASKNRNKQIIGSEKIKALYRKAEAQYESAIEQLESDLGQDASLAQWFDRKLDFTVVGEIRPATHSVPRTITSRSVNNKNVQFTKNGKSTVAASVAQQSKTDIKRDMVQRELDEMSEIYSALEKALSDARAAKTKAAKAQTENVRELLDKLKKVR